MRLVGFILAMLALLAGPAAIAAQCGRPGLNGSPSGVSGVVNTYFPGTANASAGATSIRIGAATGANTGIAAGDLLLVIQMQDATINSNNTGGYGDGVTSDTYAQGYSAIRQSGRYEFVRATNSVGTGGGTVRIMGGTGGGLLNAYANAAATGSAGQRRFQVVRVPQYANLTLSGTLTASPWNGTSGGIVAIDVADRLTFSGGAINVSGQGFRGGGGRLLTGGSGSNGDYRTAATNAANGSKGEGIAGTPRYLLSGSALLDNGVEGYPNGSSGRGAPANAGGGGTDGNPSANDQNTGGGGGGNGGMGGKGGNAWCGAGPNGCATSGGHPGDVVPNAVGLLAMGGGGGAGTTNNESGTPGGGLASSGAAGGGIVLVRAGEIAGSGTIAANGANAYSGVTNDATGGGGAGGSVMIASIRSVSGASINVQANGGDGGSNDGGGTAHGPGGGGGGGYVARTSTVSVSASVNGGSAGTTVNGGTAGANYGATAGSSGQIASISTSAIVGASSGGECTPTITKSFATSPVLPGSPSRMAVSITNNNPTLALTAMSFVDSYPSGLVNTATPAAANSCTSATLSAPANGSSFGVSAATINAGATCTYSVNTTVTGAGDKINTIAAGDVTGSYGAVPVSTLREASATVQVSAPLVVTKTSRAFSDPVNGTANPRMIPGGLVAYTVTVTNPASYTVTSNSIVVVDAPPGNLQLFVQDVSGAGSGPVVFTNGSPSSGLTYTFTSLSSTTDDVDFSNNGGASWTYTPVANAAGVDPAVTHIRIRPKGAMAPGSSFTLQFGYLIQ